MQRARSHWKALAAAAATGVALSAAAVAMPAQAQQRENEIHFPMVRSAAATNAGCLPNAAADVEVKSLGPVEKMRVRVKGLPAHTDFDFFVIQVPNAPFGMSWYQGDIETDGHGRGTGVFVEVARLVGSFTFGTIGAHRLEARVPVQNGRGNGALRKLGAVQEGILRESARRGEEYVDQVLWSLLKEDWGENWISLAPRVH